MFFLISVFLLLLICLFSFDSFSFILLDFWIMLKKIIPILLLVYVIIFIFNFLISNKKILNFLKRWSYTRKLLFSVLFGILSSWPVYLWYWLLKQLQDVGLSLGHIATFSYARAIKLPMLPIMITYFWLKFSIIFILVLLVFSFIQSFFVDLFFNKILYLKQ
jgi:hypothetical protein